MGYFPRKELDGITRMDIDVGEAAYPVFVGENPTAIFATYVLAATSARRIVLVADENTAELFGVMYETAFIAATANTTTVPGSAATAAPEVIALTVPAGEACKTWDVVGQLCDAMAQAQVERDDLIVALGGGAVSDLVGFVAHIYKRGMAFALISTTLLSMVDAAIGGKTAIDLAGGKNLVGAFHHPLAVLADTRCLEHLSETEFSSGLAEVAKTAFIEGEELTAFCEEHAAALRARDAALCTELILRCMEFKAIVVASDPFDRGARECLNYGHTLAHAIEREAGYGAIAHGMAVAEGIRFAARVGVQMSGASMETVARQDALLTAFGIAPLAERWTPLQMMDALRADKKVRDGKVRMVLLADIGQWEVVSVDDEILIEHLRAWEQAIS
ncbi:MAG: 3-dehydroquinate synthase [Coriobacteriia bacterium]|nr:3-dehydroquinate synthase [Coriobacteriia bacterium]